MATLRHLSRSLRTSATRSAEGGGYRFVDADSTSTMLALYHKVNLVALGLAPICFITSQSPLQMPFDLMLGLVLPLHGHIGMNLVLTDYIKKVFGAGAVAPARLGLAGFTGVTVLGLLKLNLTGPGITETVKSFWRPTAA